MSSRASGENVLVKGLARLVSTLTRLQTDIERRTTPEERIAAYLEIAAAAYTRTGYLAPLPPAVAATYVAPGMIASGEATGITGDLARALEDLGITGARRTGTPHDAVIVFPAAIVAACGTGAEGVIPIFRGTTRVSVRAFCEGLANIDVLLQANRDRALLYNTGAFAVELALSSFSSRRACKKCPSLFESVSNATDLLARIDKNWAECEECFRWMSKYIVSTVSALNIMLVSLLAARWAYSLETALYPVEGLSAARSTDTAGRRKKPAASGKIHVLSLAYPGWLLRSALLAWRGRVVRASMVEAFVRVLREYVGLLQRFVSEAPRGSLYDWRGLAGWAARVRELEAASPALSLVGPVRPDLVVDDLATLALAEHVYRIAAETHKPSAAHAFTRFAWADPEELIKARNLVPRRQDSI